MAKRKQYSSDQKARIVLESISERYTIRELARKHKIHPQLITNWRKVFIDNASLLFDHGLPSGPGNHEAELAALYEKIGQLQVEVDFLKKVRRRFQFDKTREAH